MERTLFEPLKPFPLKPADRVRRLEKRLATNDQFIVRNGDRYEVTILEESRRPFVVNSDGSIVWEYDEYDGTDTIIDNFIYSEGE